MMAKFTFPKGSQRWGHYQNKDPRKAAQLLLCLLALTCCFYRSWTKINVLGQTETRYQYHAKSPHTECNPNVGFDQPNPKKKKKKHLWEEKRHGNWYQKMVMKSSNEEYFAFCNGGHERCRTSKYTLYKLIMTAERSQNSPQMLE
jgi:predicted DNA-binding WGR domain protein